MYVCIRVIMHTRITNRNHQLKPHGMMAWREYPNAKVFAASLSIQKRSGIEAHTVLAAVVDGWAFVERLANATR
jgi:hypothetical protein